MSFMEKLMVTLVVLVAVGHLINWINAREIKGALELSAREIAMRLAENDAIVRTQLAEIYHRVDGRLDLALDKVTRLETALAKERGVEPPPPNPLADSTVPPAEE